MNDDNMYRFGKMLDKSSKELTTTEKRRLNRLYKIAESTKDLEYGCKFANGTCRHQREGRVKFPEGYRSWDTERCCCMSCASTLGYYDYRPRTEEEISVMRERYDQTTGYWRKGEGCTLPRKYRSKICLVYNCNKNIEQRNQVNLICDKISRVLSSIDQRTYY